MPCLKVQIMATERTLTVAGAHINSMMGELGAKLQMQPEREKSDGVERIGGLDCWKMHVKVADQKFLIERTTNFDMLLMDFFEERSYHLVCVENCGGEVNCGRDRRLFFKQELNGPGTPRPIAVGPPKCPLGPLECARRWPADAQNRPA